jgi:hypothetical protein
LEESSSPRKNGSTQGMIAASNMILAPGAVLDTALKYLC